MADPDPNASPRNDDAGMPALPLEAKAVLGGLGQFADFISKIGGVAIAIAVGVTGYHLQKSSTESQLLNQREQAETSVRAEMFKTVAEKVVKAKSEITPSEKAVFAEVLALNFHQHIELKPLLLDIERQLIRECATQMEAASKAAAAAKAGIKPKVAAAPDAPAVAVSATPCDPTDLNELRSAATRVKSRQLQIIADAFSGATTAGRKHASGIVDAVPATVQYISLQASGARPIGNAPTVSSGCAAPENEGGINACVHDQITFALPDRKSTLSISVRSVDFERARASLSVGYRKQCPGEAECLAAQTPSTTPATATAPVMPRLPGSPGQCGLFVSDADLERAEKTGKPVESSVPPAATNDVRALNDFEVTWYDFPLTDNSLLYNKTRYAVVIDRICPTEKVIRLGLVWFPQDYAPTYERPITHAELMSRLGLK